MNSLMPYHMIHCLHSLCHSIRYSVTSLCAPYQISFWILHIPKDSGSTLDLDTQYLLIDVFSCFSAPVSEIVPPIIFAFLFLKASMEILIFVFYNTVWHLENAEMTPELHDDLTDLSLNNLRDFFKITYPNRLRNFIVCFLNCLKKLVSTPSFSLIRSPYIYAFHDTAIIRCQSCSPNFSS